MRIFFAMMIGFLIHLKSIAQTPSSDLTETFAFSVHSIDDFFDRFNARKNTAFENYVHNNFPGYELKRERLILSLFDYDYLALNKSNAELLIRQVSDSTNPQFIKYEDEDWFAELECKVYYKGVPKNIRLILKVEQSGPDTYHWAIVSAKAGILNVKAQDNYKAKPKDKSTDIVIGMRKYFLSPVSHGIDFANLRNVFINNTHIEDYIYKGPRSSSLLNFISLVQNSQLKFQQVNKISYRLAQLDGWMMEINYFNRDTKNSGWLISNLVKLSPEEKNKFMKTYLQL